MVTGPSGNREALSPIRLPLNEVLTLYLLGEESVLFSRRSRQLYGLDRAATVALFRLEQGEDPEAVSRDLGLSAYSEVVDALVAVLAGKESTADGYSTELPCPPDAPCPGDALPQYRLLETGFSLHGPDELLRERITPYMAHLRTGEGEKANLRIIIEAEGSVFRIVLNGAPQGDAMQPERLLPLLYDRLRKFAYQSRSYLLAIHGAVVTGGGHTLVLAGLSGSGKSTLAAALLSRGFRLLSDEPAVVDESGGVLPMPLGLGLKAGSWPVVLPGYPGLDRLPVHVRFDGQPIRYLLPSNIRLASNGPGYPATHLVFLSYGPDYSGKLELLSPVQGLRAIADAGYQVEGLDEERVVRILGWLGSLSCYSLTYSSTAEALALLGRLFSPFIGDETKR